LRLSEWFYAQETPAERLCKLEHYAVLKQQAGGEVEFLITVREYVNPPDPAMRFLAQADKQTNQKTAPYTPSGWGPSLLQALAECIQAIRKFPYEP
jgi:hypothetical protein